MEENLTLPQFEIEDFTTVDTRIVVLQTTAYVAVCLIGIPLILGIVYYEHYGVDAQKRSILNQLISHFFGTIGICVLFTGFFVCVRCWVGPLGTLAGYLATMVRRFLLELIGFLSFDIFVYKNLCHLKPLWVMSLNDNFWTTYSLAWNVIFANVVSLATLNVVLEYPSPIFQFISGEGDLSMKSEPQIDFVILWLVNCTLIVSYAVVRMIRQPPAKEPKHGQGLLFNNMSHNPALINNLQVILVFCLCALTAVPGIFAPKSGPNGFVLVILPLMTNGTIVIPLLFYCFNKNLRKFIWKEIKDWLGVGQTPVQQISILP